MKQRKQRRVKYGTVDITSPHFLVSRSDKPNSPRKPIAVLSIAETVEDMRLALLVHDAEEWPWLEKMHQKLSYYLFELKESVGYLIYHCGTLSNAYDEIYLSYIENIDCNNILYFILTHSKLLNVYNNSTVFNLNNYYVDIIVNNIFKNALGNNSYNVENYNSNLNLLQKLIYNDITLINNFKLTETVPIPKFSQIISKLNINEFCNILSYLKKLRLLSMNDAMAFLEFYYVNNKYNDHALQHS